LRVAYLAPERAHRVLVALLTYPSKYLTWLTAIVIAAPDVKAYVTGVLMNEMSQPRRSTPTAV
jgi:hypothetical protein